MLISLFAFVFCLSFVFGLCFYFVHRYLSFTCWVCSFAQPVPTSSSRRPSRRNARQADVYVAQRRAGSIVQPMPASKKMSLIRHRDEWPSPSFRKRNVFQHI